jgi:hypothetical protein
VLAIAGAMNATFAALEGFPEATVTLGASLEPVTDAVRFVVAQNAVAEPGWAKLFEAGWSDESGRPSVGVGVRAAQRIAQMHGGHAAARSLEHGTSITLVVPTKR